jgi:hypothetical protein
MEDRKEMVEIKFQTDNAAFGEPLTYEVTRILKEIADKIEGGRAGGFVLDVNGNVIGKWDIDNIDEC